LLGCCGGGFKTRPPGPLLLGHEKSCRDAGLLVWGQARFPGRRGKPHPSMKKPRRIGHAEASCLPSHEISGSFTQSLSSSRRKRCLFCSRRADRSTVYRTPLGWCVGYSSQSQLACTDAKARLDYLIKRMSVLRFVGTVPEYRTLLLPCS